MTTRRPRGFTLVEVMVACAALLLMMAGLFAVYRLGATIWLRADIGAEILGQVQTLSGKLARDVERGLSASLALAADTDRAGMSVLTANDANGRFEFDPGTGMPRWQTAVVTYFDRRTQMVYSRETPVAAGTIEQDLLQYSIDYLSVPRVLGPDGTSIDGTPPLLEQLQHGQPIAHDIDDVVFTRPTREIDPTDVPGLDARPAREVPLRALQATITVSRPRFKGGEQKIVSQTLSYFRN